MRPSEEAEMRSGAMSRDAPARPAIHSRLSFSRLSSNSRAALSCGMWRPIPDQPVNFSRRGPAQKLLPQGLVAEHLRELGEDLQMHVGCLLRHEQYEDQVHGLA